MKNITTALLCLLFSVYSFGQCDYTLKMMDSFGDGWNGNSIDVLVDGVVILDDATLTDGSEALVTFQVNTGAEVTTIWNGGGIFVSDISYEILDNDGNLSATGNSAANVETGQCIAVCPVISCSYSLNLLDSYGDGWNGSTMDVLVDGVAVLDDVTLDIGLSQGTFTFEVSEGADVTTIWNGGGTWDSEISYEILDTDGAVVGTGGNVPNGTNDIISGSITAVCPSCPAPGGLQASANSTTEATLSWTDTGAAAGYEIVVQLAGTGIPTTSGIAITGTTYTATGLSPDTTYEFYILSDCGNATLSNWAGPYEFYMGYCESVPSSNDGEGITQIVLAASTFTSAGDVTYEDFTSPTVDVPQAVETNLQITFATSYAYDTNIWIDFNNDLVYDSATELVFDGVSTNANPTTLNASFTVPNGTASGVYNMRIGTAWLGQNTPDPCYNGSYGVTVDMTINVTAPPSCVPPTDLAVALNSLDSATVSWISGGTEIAWEYVLQPQGTGAPTAAGTPTSSNPLSLSGLSPDTNYEVYLRADCGAGDFSVWTGPVDFYTGYCESVPSSNDGEGITQIVLAASTFTSAGDVTYEDFTSPTVDVPQAVETNLQITFATSYAYDTNIWIDFNNDLVYDSATELVFDGVSTNANPTTLNASFTVPNGTASGVYNMRIGTAWLGQNTPDPCYNGSYGVTVDMTINVTAPPSCVPPTDLAVALNSSDSATVSWTTGGTETAWEYVLQPQGTGAPTAAGTPTSSNPLSLSGLSSVTAYEVYLRADCGAGDFSPWTGPANFETGAGCGDTIYDSGGASGDYSNSELITTTVFPDNPGDVVTFTFLSFDTESCCDGLTVYNGPDTSSDPVDDEFRGTTIPNPITSTDPSGALTFVFDSDGSITGAGYEILISCGPPPSCLVPTNFTATLDALGSAVTLSWDANNGETQWEYVLQPQGTGVPTAAGTPLAVNPITLYGLDWDTDYEVYLRADCGAGDFSDWTAPALFSTPVQTNFTIDCGAGEVLDLSYCYTNNDTTAWLFTASTAFPVKIVFNSGDLEACCDEITIYDGPDNTGTILFNNDAADIHDLTGLEFQSTATAIYMEVDSDGSVSCDSSTTYSPWDFSVSCATCVTQTVDFSINGVCSPDYEFYVDANVSDMGDATSIDLTDNLGIITQTVTSTGVVSLGPYAANEEIIITAVNSNDASCAVESDLLTFMCPPPPNECSIVYAGEDSSFCTDNETETTLTAFYHILGQDTTEYEITSVNNCEFPSFVGGTPTSINIDDTWSGVIDIGFDFCFFGGTYDQLLIGSNGVISFELGNAGFFNGYNLNIGDTLPNSSNFTLSEANIFGVGHDIDPSEGGEINYMILGTSPSRQFVVNYNNVPHYSCNDIISTSQIILYESSNVIDINIIDKPGGCDFNDGLAVVGIQNIDDTIAYTPENRNTDEWEASNESWRFSPSVGTPNYVFEWYDGSTLVGTEETITVSPETTTTYTAAVTYNLCTGGTATVTDEVTVDVAATPFPIAADNEIFICADDDAVVLEVSLEGAQPVPNNVVYYWTYDGIDIVDGVSEADGGNTITLGGLTPEFDILEGDYLVTALNTVTGCSADTTISVSYYMNENCVDIPQGISPNGDGMNDCLVLDHLEAQEDIIKAEVYNRYGVKVFELNDYIDQWCGQDASDGSGNSNELLPVGTYFYVIQYASGREPTISWIYLNY